MRSIFLLSTLACLAAPLAAAKPMITNSEDTAARICLAFKESAERLVTACQAALDDAQRTDPERAELLTLLGEALEQTDQVDLAKKRYREAMVIDPLNIDPINALGWLFWVEDDEAQAAEWFQASVDLRPTAEGLGGLASSLWRGEQIEDEAAIEMMEAALAIEPEYVWAMRERGWMYFSTDALDEAAASFAQALDLDGDDWGAAYGLSRVQAAQGDYDAALITVNQAAQIDPDEGWTYNHRAYVLRRLGRNQQAIKDAERMIRILPDESAGYVQRAAALNNLGYRAKALESYQAGVDVGAADSFLLYWYADLLSDDGQLALACKMIERAIAQDDDDPDNYVMKAYIALEMEAFGVALAAAEAAIALEPEKIYAHYYAAVALLHSDAKDEGLARFDHAMAIGLDRDLVGRFAVELISVGDLVGAIRLRTKY